MAGMRGKVGGQGGLGSGRDGEMRSSILKSDPRDQTYTSTLAGSYNRHQPQVKFTDLNRNQMMPEERSLFGLEKAKSKDALFELMMQ